MKTIAKGTLLFMLFAAMMPYARASEIEFKPTGKPAGDLTFSLSIRRVAQRDISRGFVNLQAGTVQILVPETEYLNPSIVLSGKVIKTAVAVSGRRVDITGIMYFDGGQWLQSIDDPKAVDFAFFEKGFARGHIAGLTGDSLVFDKFGRQQELKLDDIKELRSPRIYTFSINAMADTPVAANIPFRAEADEISLKETMPLRTLSPLSVNPHKDEDADSDLLGGDDSDLPKTWPGLSPFPQMAMPGMRRYGGAAVDP